MVAILAWPVRQHVRSLVLLINRISLALYMPARTIRALQLVGRSSTHGLSRSAMYSRMRQLYQVLGHKAATYCVLYDSSGARVVTGADDCLVKVWSARTGMLLATFRGHEGQITDLAINPESTILASSDTTGAIRVWSLETGAQITTLRWHRAGTEIDTIEFSPSVDAGRRYIFSTGKDCTVKAFRWWVDDADPDTGIVSRGRVCH